MLLMVYGGWAVAVAAPAQAAVAQRQDADRPGPRSPAMVRLEEARVVLPRLDEQSMSAEAREALGALEKEFHALYRSYAGREPGSARPGNTAVTMKYPREVWKNFYAEAMRTLDRIIGAPEMPTASAGTRAGAASDAARPQQAQGIAGVPRPARDGFEDVRSALEAFHREAIAAEQAHRVPAKM
jgi:hypothetical protein